VSSGPVGFGLRQGSIIGPGGSPAVPRRGRVRTEAQSPVMKRLVLIGIFVALLAAIVAIAATWSKVTPVNPAVSPDTSATPNPTSQRK
jgi:hypothetical protein